MRREFELSEEQLQKILDASKPVRYMVFGGIPPSSPQENANAAWRALADELGFIWDTVRPVPEKGQYYFTAVVKEPNEPSRDHP
jgi:predicted TIM-barrel fold metal-dependent hydrolase